MDARTLDRVLRAALERNTMHALTDMMRDPVTNLYTRDGFLTVGSRPVEEGHSTNGSLVLICVLFEKPANASRGIWPGGGGPCNLRPGRALERKLPPK
jgi:hypothetical protein